MFGVDGVDDNMMEPDKMLGVYGPMHGWLHRQQGRPHGRLPERDHGPLGPAVTGLRERARRADGPDHRAEGPQSPDHGTYPGPRRELGGHPRPTMPLASRDPHSPAQRCHQWNQAQACSPPALKRSEVKPSKVRILQTKRNK